MKKLYLSLIVFTFALMVSAQTSAPDLAPLSNIVPNPSFEMYSSTPIGWFYKGKHFTEVMKYWSSATAASPDVFGPKVRVPTHWAAKGFGDQRPRSGNSMTGITAYGCEEGKPHCREYIQIQLQEPLVVGQKYYAEFWVTHLPRSLQINSIGMFFSKKKINIKTDSPIELKPQIEAEKILDAKNHRWIKVSGEFTADSEAEYLLLGNFRPDSLTQMRKVFANSLNYAYYYIDDVLLRKQDPIIPVPIKEDDLCCIEIEEGKVFRLRNIFFDHDKAELLPRSYVELGKLLQLMRDYPTMVIEIRGHTDSVGDHDYNIYLSRKRAKAVVEYLNENGIRRQRTRYKGFGSTEPIASNENDDGRQLNRRVELVIVHK